MAGKKRATSSGDNGGGKRKANSSSSNATNLRRSTRGGRSFASSSFLPPSPPAPAPVEPSVIKPLGDWIIRDLEPNEGKRLLLPFLTTRDKLRLSSCCRGLKRYRNNLGNMLLRYMPRTAHSKRALSNLLSEQVNLTHLRMTEDSESLMLLVLGWLKGGICPGLKALTLPDMAYGGADKLGSLLHQGCQQLEEVHISLNSYLYDGKRMEATRPSGYI